MSDAKKIIVGIFLSLLLTTLDISAFSNHVKTCRGQMMSISITNLKGVLFPGRVWLTRTIEKLLKNPEASAYQLSMPLLAAAQSGNPKHYKRAWLLMDLKMAGVEQKPLEAWLRGRMLLAAQSMQDTKNIERTRIALSKTLASLGADTHPFTVWAVGYAAGLNPAEYTRLRADMLAGANHLTQEFFQAKNNHESIAKQLDARSNAIWAWVMITQAAAESKQEADYHQALDAIKRIAGQPTIGAALDSGLIRTEKSNDFPAWAEGIVRLATLTIGDETSFNEIDQYSKSSIAAAKAAGKEEEAMLGLVNFELANERQNKLECQPKSMSPSSY